MIKNIKLKHICKMRKTIMALLLGLFYLSAPAQSLNNTKYVEIKGVYDFQTTFNQYRLNSFLKFQLEQAGFQVYYDNEDVPAEVKADPCQALKCIVTRDKSMLATRLNIQLVNCNGHLVFSSDGESRLKNHNKSHVDAVKDALEHTVIKKMQE